MQPAVKLEHVGQSVSCLDYGYVTIVDYMGADLSIVEAARVSYDQPSKGDAKDVKLLRSLMRDKHTSPFEHAKIRFEIALPIFVMRQLVRHRMMNLNEMSARYTELPETYYTPHFWRLQAKQNKQGSTGYVTLGNDAEVITDAYQLHMKGLFQTYKGMIQRGVSREVARMILPVSVYTKCHVCWDLNNLMKFLVLRLDNHAQWEIRAYARAIRGLAELVFPETMEAFSELVLNQPGRSMRAVYCDLCHTERAREWEGHSEIIGTTHPILCPACVHFEESDEPQQAD